MFNSVKGQGQFRRIAELDSLEANPKGRGAWTPRVNAIILTDEYTEYFVD